jgi:plastocyanin domain-containing protein
MKIARSNLYKLSIVLACTVFALVLITATSKSNNQSEFNSSAVKTIDGVQYISLSAGLGYTPNRIMASASLPTKLKIKTNNTYDCTAYLNIPKLNIKKFLPPTGTTEIALDNLKPGEEIEGFCGSDTYKFVIRFS